MAPGGSLQDGNGQTGDSTGAEKDGPTNNQQGEEKLCTQNTGEQTGGLAEGAQCDGGACRESNERQSEVVKEFEVLENTVMERPRTSGPQITPVMR